VSVPVPVSVPVSVPVLCVSVASNSNAEPRCEQLVIH